MKDTQTEIVFQNDLVTIYDDPKSELLRAKWSHAFDSEQWLTATQFICSQMKLKSYTRYIADGGSASIMDSTTMEAIKEVVIPMFLNAGMRKMAMVLPEDLSMEMTMQTLIMRVSAPLQVSAFNNLPEAKAWVCA